MTWIPRVLWAVQLTLAPGIAVSQSEPGRGDTAGVASTSLAPGDLIVVKIWREPDLSDTARVDNAGNAVFPKLGSIKVTGVEHDSLQQLLVREYGQYLQNPSIQVTILRRITIWGAVAQPGAYPVDLTMTITDALALAGGATPNGQTDKVELRRGSQARVIDLSGPAQQVGDLSLRSGDQLFVRERSWMSRNSGLVVAALGTVATVTLLLARPR